MWNPLDHNNDENTKWSWLRAIEWGRWPLFMSQLFAPLLLIIVPWYIVIAIFFLSNIFWAILIRYRFCNYGLLLLGADVMVLKWPITIGSTIYLFYNANSKIALLALLWPFVAIFLGIITPTKIGVIQKTIMKQMGYETK